MVSTTKDARAIPATRQITRRQADVRKSWSPLERRERARQASAQLDLLRALMNTPGHPQSHS
jgi:hypothetical protein